MSIFVFGSNLAGRHGRGAALAAKLHHGAIYGQGVGRQGDSYAIPTKDERLRALPLDVIAFHVNGFKEYARLYSGETFFVTRVGCGLAGYKDADIAPMFRGAPRNCIFPESWRSRISPHADHGEADEEGAPYEGDCPCRTTAARQECAEAGCGFCGVRR